jgi:hypothetical protein
MLRDLSARQVAEMEAYSRIEGQPGNFTASEREAENLRRLKERFAPMWRKT